MVDLIQILQQTPEREFDFEKINSLVNGESETILEELGHVSLDRKEFYTALDAFVKLNTIDDVLFSNIGQGIVQQGIKALEGEPPFWNPSKYKADIMNSINAFNRIQDIGFKERCIRIAAQTVESLTHSSYILPYQEAAYLYGHIGDFDRIAQLGDKAVYSALCQNENKGFAISVALEIYQHITDNKLYRKKIRETLSKLLKQEMIPFDAVAECLKATSLNKTRVRWQKKTIDKLVRLADKHCEYGFIFDTVEREQMQENKEYYLHLADTMFEHELQISDPLHERDFGAVKKAYDIIGPDRKKWLEIGKIAENHGELDLAYSAYDMAVDSRRVNRVIRKLKDMGEFFKAGINILSKYQKKKGGNKTKQHYTRFGKLREQKELVALLNEAMDARQYLQVAGILINTRPELARENILNRFDLIRTEIDVPNQHHILENTEKILTPDKISTIANRAYSVGESGFGDALSDLSTYLSELKDPFDILRGNDPNNKLFFRLKDYLERVPDAKDPKNWQSKANNKTLNLLKRTCSIRDISKIKSLLDNFNLYEDNTYLIDIGRMAAEEGNVYLAMESLKLAGDRHLIEQGRWQIDNGEYGKGFYLLKTQGDYAIDYLSHALVNRFRDQLKSDPKKGLEFLISLTKSKMGSKFKLKMEQNRYEGFKSEKVMGINFSSGILDMNIAVKLEKVDKRYSSQMGEIEAKLCKSINSVFALPEPITSDVIDGYSLLVTKNIDGVRISDVLGERIVFRGREYMIKARKIVEKVFRHVNYFYSDLEQGLQDLSINYGDDFAIDGTEFFSRKQLENEGDIQELAVRLFGVHFTQRAYMPAMQAVNSQDFASVWNKDMNANNIIYNPEKDEISFIDFNLLEYRPPEFDMVKFVDTPIPNCRYSREELIGMIGGRTENFDAMALYLNLRHMIARYAKGDIEAARFFYQRSGCDYPLQL